MKLKQKFAIGLCAFYVLSVVGIALSMHFCGGKLASVALYSNKLACKYCKTEPVEKKDDDCCKNKQVDVKVKDSHKAETGFKLPKLFEVETTLPHRIANFIEPVITFFSNKLSNKAPPNTSSISKQVLNCVFRI
ncbi:HYC_CC_PP family protein [Pedobacter namyangjuensis]|uniref:HYC_CC_PP family protein n=1 Tax=Pedobacter namyangjuensis TaxID=600626 RepID=UPI000DE4ABC3|nr:hypothetical protein [Pedobacter namyangjuensis]